MFPSVSFEQFMTKKEKGGGLKSPKSRGSGRRTSPKRYRAEGQNAPYQNSTTNIMIDNHEKSKNKTSKDENNNDATLLLSKDVSKDEEYKAEEEEKL